MAREVISSDNWIFFSGKTILCQSQFNLTAGDASAYLAVAPGATTQLVDVGGASVYKTHKTKALSRERFLTLLCPIEGDLKW